MAKLTENIAGLFSITGQKDRPMFDNALPGLAVRIPTHGTKTFRPQYTPASQRRRAPISQWDAITPKTTQRAAKATTARKQAKAKVNTTKLIEKARAKQTATTRKATPEPLPRWRLHNSHRTAMTWMAENDVPRHVADKILKHVQSTISGVAAVHQRGQLLAERKAALKAWVVCVMPV